MNKDDALKDTLLARFNRRGGSGKLSGPFGELPKEEQNRILVQVDLEADETPIFASYSSVDEWFLLTSRRLISNGNNKFIVHLARLIRVKIKYANDLIFKYIVVEDLDGCLHEITLTESHASIGLLNILKHIVRLNNKHLRP